MERKVILASSSPRRKELLSAMGVSYACVSPDVDESFSGPPWDAVVEIARRKARAVAANAPEAIVIGADTVVVRDGEILGKPHDEKEAVRMLKSLSGRIHQVMTGVCVLSSERKECFCDVSEVEFYPLQEDQIRRYVATGEPMDKAGAYGIQGEGFFLVKRINGDFYSIMGFPAARTARVLKKWME